MENLPLPEHLRPEEKGEDASTVSINVLTKMADTSSSALTAALASSWVADLDRTLEATKDRIFNRIQSELTTFERQLETSKSVQSRFKNLSSNIDELEDALANETSGLLPTLLRTLTAHSALAQDTQDAVTLKETLAYISECRSVLTRLEQHVGAGRLGEAVDMVKELQTLVEAASVAASRAEIMTDLKARLRTLNNNVQEQVSEAYSRSVKITSTSFTVSPAVPVSQSQVIMTLADILKSIAPQSLTISLSSLKRDLVAHFVDFPLQQHVSPTLSDSTEGPPSHTLSLLPMPAHLHTSKANSKLTIDYLRTFITFLSSHFLPFLPQPQDILFPKSLSKPLTQGILNFVLIPSIPSSLTEVPAFLRLIQDAVTFEEEFITRILGDNEERDVKKWAGNVATHYGRKRRLDLLEKARRLILAGGHGEFQVDVVEEGPAKMDDGMPAGSVSSACVAEPDVSLKHGGDEDDVETDDEVVEAAWDFDDDAAGDSDVVDVTPNGNGHAQGSVSNAKDVPQKEADNEVAWNFEDEEANVVEESKTASRPANGTSDHKTGDSEEPSTQDGSSLDDDDSDAWGWGDGNDDLNELKATATKDNDDVWDDSWNKTEVNHVDLPPVSPSKPVKVAKRLEKFTAKSKTGSPEVPTSPHLTQNILSSPLSSSFTSSHTKSPSHASSLSPSSSFASINSSAYDPRRSTSTVPTRLQESTRPSKPPSKEFYTVSTLTRDLLGVVRAVLSEGLECQRSNVFSRSKLQLNEAATPPSQLILRAAPSVLELYRALFTVTHAEELKSKPDRAMRFSNDCIYMSEEIERLIGKDVSHTQEIKDRLLESTQKLSGLGDWWYEDNIEKQRTLVLNDLQRTEGLADTGDPERFDECESVMNDILRNIRSVGYQWQKVLPRSKYLRAIGQIVETALAKVIEDVLALPDIPELDSRRLSELCRILNALEGLFADDPDMGSVAIDYVPSWLKYSYLTELLEASIADISYLFDEGALIDFEVTELASLVRALFADTPLRANTIAKLMRGHPVVQH